jgi:hypothetical protein
LLPFEFTIHSSITQCFVTTVFGTIAFSNFWIYFVFSWLTHFWSFRLDYHNASWLLERKKK